MRKFLQVGLAFALFGGLLVGEARAADTIYPLKDNLGNNFPVRLKDNGDGTYSFQLGNGTTSTLPLFVQSTDYTMTAPGTSAPLAVPFQNVAGGVPGRLYDKGNISAGNNSGTCTASCNATSLLTGDFSDFAEISIQITAAGTGTLTFQESNDNFAAAANVAQCTSRAATGATDPRITTATATGLYTCKIGARYFRAQFTAYTSGTFTAFWAAGKETNTALIQSTFVANGPTAPASFAPAPTALATLGITSVVSGAAEATHVLKASAGNMYSVYATNLTATAGFLLILNATSAPADGVVTPTECAPLPANGSTSINYSGGPPAQFATGITAVITSAATCFTKTTGVITGYIKGSVF